MGRKAAWGKDAEAALPQWFCSSDDFRRLIRNDHPELSVPETAIVYIGLTAVWDPTREEPHPPDMECPDRAMFRAGSLFCCPKCQRSGYERQLAEQRRLAGYPPPERPVIAGPPAPKLDHAGPAGGSRTKRPPHALDAKRQAQWRNFAWARPHTPPLRSRRETS